MNIFEEREYFRAEIKRAMEVIEVATQVIVLARKFIRDSYLTEDELYETQKIHDWAYDRQLLPWQQEMK